MSDLQSNGYSDEDKYANDSFETEVPESSVYGSDEEISKTEMPKSASKEFRPFGRGNEFWTCESSSDEDDVVLGQTVAEINTDPCDFDDDNISLTPAARVFQMASASRNSSRIKNMPNHEVLTECEDFDDDFEEIDDMTVDTESDNDDVFGKYTKTRTEKEIMYDERITFETSGIEVDEVYTDVSVSDGGEMDIGEPNFYQEPKEKEKDFEMDPTEEKESDYENGGLSDVEASPTNSDYYDDEKTIGAASIFTASIHSETKSLTKSETKSEHKSEPHSDPKTDPKSESKSVRTDDSMEDFKRRVMLSQRMRCRSDGGGDRARTKIVKSGIPVWVGNNRLGNYLDMPKQLYSAQGARSMIPVRNTRTHSLPDFSEAETLTPRDIYYKENEGAFGFESAAYSNRSDYMAADFYSMYTATATEDGDPCAYSMQMEMFMDADDIPKKPKKLKAGERRNKSFSNERLRDIERHNHILLHKILNQKPTYVLDEKKKKKDKFACLPPTTRVTSAEINRKKEQRQIDMDNQLLKRKLEAIARRKPKAKAK